MVRGHKHIINLIEASASPIPGTTGYEVFILMEYAPGGGIIDMMNTRLQNRLTEPEVLKIFGDVVEAVCWMHTRHPAIMHRDLKVSILSDGLYRGAGGCSIGCSLRKGREHTARRCQPVQSLRLWVCNGAKRQTAAEHARDSSARSRTQQTHDSPISSTGNVRCMVTQRCRVAGRSVPDRLREGLTGEHGSVARVRHLITIISQTYGPWVFSCTSCASIRRPSKSKGPWQS